MYTKTCMNSASKCSCFHFPFTKATLNIRGFFPSLKLTYIHKTQKCNKITKKNSNASGLINRVTLKILTHKTQNVQVYMHGKNVFKLNLLKSLNAHSSNPKKYLRVQ